MSKVYCYSHDLFDNLCQDKGWNDNNIPEDSAFISIVGTEPCQKYYLNDIELHWFKENHPNVLNLEFDDIAEDLRSWNGHVFYGLSQKQAEELVEFIDRNKGKDFYIHCRAGMSRSQGVVRYILDTYGKRYNYETRIENPCNTPNIDVVGKLKAAYRAKYLDFRDFFENYDLHVERITVDDDIEAMVGGPCIRFIIDEENQYEKNTQVVSAFYFPQSEPKKRWIVVYSKTASTKNIMTCSHAELQEFLEGL